MIVQYLAFCRFLLYQSLCFDRLCLVRTSHKQRRRFLQIQNPELAIDRSNILIPFWLLQSFADFSFFFGNPSTRVDSSSSGQRKPGRTELLETFSEKQKQPLSPQIVRSWTTMWTIKSFDRNELKTGIMGGFGWTHCMGNNFLEKVGFSVLHL